MDNTVFATLCGEIPLLMYGCRRLDEDLNFVLVSKCFENVQISITTDRRWYFCVEMQKWFVFSISVDVHIPANVFATIMWSMLCDTMYFFNVYFITFKKKMPVCALQ